MKRPRSYPGMLVPIAFAGLAACTPPEAERVRGGGAGADPGNRVPIIELHAGAEPYYRTPCLTTVKPCTGPLPRFGLPEVDRDSND